MLGSSNLVAFVMTSDAARAKAFYGKTLGLKYTGQDDFAVIFDANGVMVRVSIMPGHTPTEHPVFGWVVPDIAATATALGKAGVTFEKYPFMQQDELGIWTSPDGGTKVAFFKDPDGNILSISELASAGR